MRLCLDRTYYSKQEAKLHLKNVSRSSGPDVGELNVGTFWSQQAQNVATSSVSGVSNHRDKGSLTRADFYNFGRVKIIFLIQ